MKTIKQKIFEIHDVECNQKYGDGLPYSFHLKAVHAQNKFKPLFSRPIMETPCFSGNATILDVALWGHDLIEDARFTYSDLKKFLIEDIKQYRAHDFDGEVVAEKVADIIYAVTDEKGKTRAERKNDKYYEELSKNRTAVYVKLCDIAANTLYSKLTDSSMYEKYKKEFPKVKEKLSRETFEGHIDLQPMFEYVENL